MRVIARRRTTRPTQRQMRPTRRLSCIAWKLIDKLFIGAISDKISLVTAHNEFQSVANHKQDRLYEGCASSINYSLKMHILSSKTRRRRLKNENDDKEEDGWEKWSLLRIRNAGVKNLQYTTCNERIARSNHPLVSAVAVLRFSAWKWLPLITVNFVSVWLFFSFWLCHFDETIILDDNYRLIFDRNDR